MYRILNVLIFLFVVTAANSQESSVFISNESNSFYEKGLYDGNVQKHTSLRPLLYSEINWAKADSSFFSSKKNVFLSKMLNENLLETKNENFNLILNPIFSYIPIYELVNSENVYLLEGGVSLRANYKNKLSFQTNFSINEQTLLSAYSSEATNNLLIPNYGKAFNFTDGAFLYSQFDANLSYSPSKYFNLQLGQGKNFIGDGYRSLFLSGNANSYPFFKATTSFWKLKYQLIYASLKHIDGFNNDFKLQNKWSVIHYLSLNLGKRVSVGLFETIISNPQDSVANRGFDAHYLNPIIFFRPVEYTVGSPDNAILGLSAKIRLFTNLNLYAQLVLDEFNFAKLKEKNGNWANKFGIQAGFKSFNTFKIENLFLQGEINLVRPFTYSHAYTILNYGHYYEAMAHPYGANFYEALGIVNYRFKNRWSVKLKAIYTLLGVDQNTTESIGQDIFRSYSIRKTEDNNTITQGLKTDILQTNVSISYLINPKWNTEAILQFTNYYVQSLETNKFTMISLGLRSNVFTKNNSRIRF